MMNDAPNTSQVNLDKNVTPFFLFGSILKISLTFTS